MRVEFLGHGLHKDHTNTVGHYMMDSFKNDDYYSFVGFSAFTKMSGINRIKKELLVASKKFKSLNLSHSLTVICYEIFKQMNFNKFQKEDGRYSDRNARGRANHSTVYGHHEP